MEKLIFPDADHKCGART